MQYKLEAFYKITSYKEVLLKERVIIPALQTKRLILRPFLVRDVEDLREWLSLLEVRYYLNMDDVSAQAIEDWVNARLPYKKDMGIRHFSWALTLKSRKNVIGNIELWPTAIGRAAGELGFALNPAYQGKGLMKEAVKEIIRYGFQNLGLLRMQALVAVDNQVSINFIENLSFIYEGCLRQYVQTQYYKGDAYIYSLLAEEWKP